MDCPKCGADVQVGEWPWCPHGRPRNFDIQTDEQWIGGKTFENLGHEPVTVYSRSELKREMQARGLEHAVRHVGLQGSDKNPNTTRWI